MSACRTPEPCGQTPCEALTEIQHLLPPGQLWRLDEGRTFTALMSAFAEAKSCTMAGICQEWAEADPCTAVRTLERWAKIWCFPTDCVDLTQEKMCEWIDLLFECEPGSQGFILSLLDFAEVDLTGVEVKFSNCCDTLFPGCGCVTFCAEYARFTDEPCSCDWDLFKQMQNPCGWLHLPEIECLRERYFPINLKVKYEVTDCDPNLIRHLQAA